MIRQAPCKADTLISFNVVVIFWAVNILYKTADKWSKLICEVFSREKGLFHYRIHDIAHSVIQIASS